MLAAKAIVQNLGREKVGWDEAMPANCQKEWIGLINNLTELETLSVGRCFKHQDTHKISKTELHLFSDRLRSMRIT